MDNHKEPRVTEQADVRKAFEAWHRSKFATKHYTGQPTRDMHNGIYAEQYGPKDQQLMWEVWQACAALTRQAAPEAPAKRTRRRATDAGQLAELILADSDGGYMRISSDLEYCADGAMRFTVTNPDTGRRFGVHIGLAELTDDPDATGDPDRCNGAGCETGCATCEPAPATQQAGAAVGALAQRVLRICEGCDGFCDPCPFDEESAATTASASTIKTWQQRVDWTSKQPATKLMVEAMKAENAELRAALAQQGAAQAAHAGAAEDPVVEANRQLLLDRSRVGIAKYGVTLAGAGLSRVELVQHALEEALDLANYLQTIIQADRVAIATSAKGEMK